VLNMATGMRSTSLGEGMARAALRRRSKAKASTCAVTDAGQSETENLGRLLVATEITAQLAITSAPFKTR